MIHVSNHNNQAQPQESWHLMQKALKSHHYPKRKTTLQIDFPISSQESQGNFDSNSSPLNGHTFFGALSINASLKTPL